MTTALRAWTFPDGSRWEWDGRIGEGADCGQVLLDGQPIPAWRTECMMALCNRPDGLASHLAAVQEGHPCEYTPDRGPFRGQTVRHDGMSVYLRLENGLFLDFGIDVDTVIWILYDHADAGREYPMDIDWRTGQVRRYRGCTGLPLRNARALKDSTRCFGCEHGEHFGEGQVGPMRYPDFMRLLRLMSGAEIDRTPVPAPTRPKPAAAPERPRPIRAGYGNHTITLEEWKAANG